MQKTFILAMSVLASTAGYAQQKATLTGNITGLTDEAVYLYYKSGGKDKTDTIPVKGGRFTWKGNLLEPKKAFFMTKKGYAEFFIENASMKLDGNADNLYKSKLTGSPVQAEYIAYQKTMEDLDAIENPIYEQFSKVKDDDAAMAVLEDRLDSCRNIARGRALDYIRKHPSSFVSIQLAAGGVASEYARVLDAYNMLSPQARNTEAGKAIAENLVILKRSAIGATMKDFKQADTDGKEFASSQLRGKYVLVDFWASWCGPCRAENPNVLKAYNAYKDKNFTVLGVSLDDKADRWKKAIEEDKMPWQQVSDLKGWKNEVSEYYGIRGIPSNFLIDPNGVIVAKDLRGVALHRKLAEVIK